VRQINKTPEQILAGTQTQFPVGAAPVPLPADQDGRLPQRRARRAPLGRMLGHDRPDPGDLPGSKLTALEADGPRGGVAAISAPAIPVAARKQKAGGPGGARRLQPPAKPALPGSRIECFYFRSINLSVFVSPAARTRTK
jgi:hypothetical protein